MAPGPLYLTDVIGNDHRQATFFASKVRLRRQSPHETFPMQLSLKAFVLAVVLAMPAFAAAATEDSGLKFDDVRTQQAEIRAGVMARSGPYKDMSSSTRTQLLNRQTEMLAIIDGKTGPGELNEEQRTRVFNSLEWIEATINQAEDERLICERRATIGSNRKERVCRTAAQMREERERAREEWDRSDVQMRRGN